MSKVDLYGARVTKM